MICYARLTINNQTTLPSAVIEALGLSVGNFIEFAVDGGVVTAHDASGQLSQEVLFKSAQTNVMCDWNTPEDDETFRDL